MHFKYYFFALAAICALLFSACKNNAGTNEPDTPISGVLRNPDSVRIYKMSASGDVLDAVHYYRYDVHDNMLLDSTATNKTVMSYDAHNNLLERKDYSFYAERQEWKGDIIWRYTYDEQNKMAVMTNTYGFTDDDEDVPVKKSVFTWTDDTHAVAQVFTNTAKLYLLLDSIEWVLSDQAEYEYNSHGKELSIKHYFDYYLKPNVSQMFEVLMEYDQFDHMISYKESDWDLSKGDCRVMVSEKYSYDYDEDGNILVKYIYSATTEEPVLCKKAVYYY